MPDYLSTLIDAETTALLTGTPAVRKPLFVAGEVVGGSVYPPNEDCWIAGYPTSGICVSTSLGSTENLCFFPVTPIATSGPKIWGVGAAHAPQSIGNTNFWRAEDGTVVSRTIAASYPIEGTDILLYRLSSALPSNVSAYRIFEPIKVWQEGGYVTAFHVIATNQNNAAYPMVVQFALDIGNLDGRVLVRPETVHHTAWYDYAHNYDSGHPIFAALDGDLILISTFSTSASGPDYSRYVPQINAIISPETVSTVDIDVYTPGVETPPAAFDVGIGYVSDKVGGVTRFGIYSTTAMDGDGTGVTFTLNSVPQTAIYTPSLGTGPGSSVWTFSVTAAPTPAVMTFSVEAGKFRSVYTGAFNAAKVNGAVENNMTSPPPPPGPPVPPPPPPPPPNTAPFATYIDTRPTVSESPPDDALNITTYFPIVVDGVLKKIDVMSLRADG